MTDRRVLVAFALIASVLVATAPISAGTNTAVGSIHETDSDFNSAQQLTNVTVTGSGKTASVDYDEGYTSIDDFEDDDITTGSGNWDGWSGDTANFTSQSGTVLAGSFSGNFTSDDFNHNIRTTRTAGPTTADFETKVRIDTAPANVELVELLFKSGGNGGTEFLSIQFETDSDIAVDLVDTGTDWSADTTYVVTVLFDFSNNEAEVKLDGSSLGTFSFSSSVSNWDFFRLNARTDVTDTTANVYIDDVREANFTDSGTYRSSNHTVDNAVSGFTNLTFSNANATVTWEGWDGSSWNQIDQTTYSTDGNKSVNFATAFDKYRVTVAFNDNSTHLTDASATLEDEGVQFTNHDPTVNDSSISPANGTKLSSKSVTLEIDVNDTDFNTSQGDSVTVEFFTKGPNDGAFTSAGTDTLTSNGTASLTITVQTGGMWEWNVTATDDHDGGGASVGVSNSSVFNFSVPSNITIREESEPHDKITSATATIKFFELTEDNPEIVTRDAVNGEVDLSGLPTGTSFVAQVSADGYHNRTVFIDSLFEQQTIFLLNTSRSSVENTFTVSDQTGNFPPSETKLKIQKAINDTEYDASGDGYNWTTIAGDKLGADQAFVADLNQSDRYRIIVENEDGDQRILGAYVAENSGTVDLQIGQVVADPEQHDGPAINASRTNTTQVSVTAEFNDTSGNVTKVWVHIYNASDTSDDLFSNTSFTDANVSVTSIVPAAENDTEWVVEITWLNGDGELQRFKQIVGPREPVLGTLPDWLKALISIGAIWTVAGLFSQLNGDIGALVVAGLGGLFWFVDFLPADTGIGVVVLAMITAGLIFINERRAAGV